jgi:hypothetical protein
MKLGQAMKDKAKICAGLAIFLAIALFPVLYNFVFGGSARRPEIVIKTKGIPGKDKCVMPAEYMRASHMELLSDWREAVVRSADRVYISPDGRRFRRSLTGTCMDCHANKSSFCDRCHDYAATQPNCWNCHIAPNEEAR